MTKSLGIILLVLFSLAGAVLEGTWTAMPAAFVQFNGLLLLVSSLLLLGTGANLFLRRTS